MTFDKARTIVAANAANAANATRHGENVAFGSALPMAYVRPEKDEPVFTPGQLAPELRVDPRTIHRWCHEGKLDHWVTPGGHMRIPLSALERFVAAHSRSAEHGSGCTCLRAAS